MTAWPGVVRSPSDESTGPTEAGQVLAHVGLGANLGDMRHTLQAALQALASLADSRLVACSRLYRSEPVDAGGPDYLNAVAELWTTLSAPALLFALLEIEERHGRLRPHRNAPRTLDLDLLLYGNQAIATTDLTVPHPRLQLRAFVLRPLADLQPSLVVPGLGRIGDLLSQVAAQRIDRLDS